MTINESIGANIKTVRQSVCMNQTDFAARIGIKQSTLSNYEHGTAAPSIEVLQKICKEFNVSANFLLDLPEKHKGINSYGEILEFFHELKMLLGIDAEMSVQLFDTDKTPFFDFKVLGFRPESPDNPYSNSIITMMFEYLNNYDMYDKGILPHEVFFRGTEKVIDNLKSYKLNISDLEQKLENELKMYTK
ncbi:MAG: helix-turn-helix transcriptional regulator [Prevotella sp.]|nr:helix-turn-helix transcriptional regulator [Prevotella sp.]